MSRTRRVSWLPSRHSPRRPTAVVNSMADQLDAARHVVEVDDLQTQYFEAGEGEPLVLLHGGEFGGGAEFCWENNIFELARHYRVIAPDLLGFGGTAKVHDFVDGKGRR